MQNGLAKFIRMICVYTILKQQFYSINREIICTLNIEHQETSALLIYIQNAFSFVLFKKFMPIKWDKF